MTNKIEIIEDPADAEDADYVVCALGDVKYPQFPDNLFCDCCKCGRLVQYRPHAPKSPPKICYECAQPFMEREAAADNLQVTMTPKTKQEVMDYLAKQKLH